MKLRKLRLNDKIEVKEDSIVGQKGLRGKVTYVSRLGTDIIWILWEDNSHANAYNNDHRLDDYIKLLK